MNKTVNSRIETNCVVVGCLTDAILLTGFLCVPHSKNCHCFTDASYLDVHFFFVISFDDSFHVFFCTSELVFRFREIEIKENDINE